MRRMLLGILLGMLGASGAGMAAVASRASSAGTMAPPRAAEPVPASEYAYAWPLLLGSDSSAYQVELVPEVYAALHDAAMGDLEIVNADGVAVPMQRQRTRDATATLPFERRFPLPLFVVPHDARPDADESLQIRIDRDSGGRLSSVATLPQNRSPAPADGDFILDASGLNAAAADAGNNAAAGANRVLRSLWLTYPETLELSAEFAVDASDDLQHWRTWVASASVVDLHRGDARLQHRQIALNGGHANYLRLRRLDHGPALSAALEVSADVAVPASHVAPVRTWIEATEVRTESAAELDGRADRTPGYVYALPGYMPVDTLRIGLGAENTVAVAQISTRRTGSGQTSAPAWRTRLRATLFRLRQENQPISNDEIGFPERRTVPHLDAERVNELRLLSTPVLAAAPTLSVGYVPDRLTFLAQGAAPFRLVAGHRSAQHVDVPLEAALAPLRAGQAPDWALPMASMGPRQTQRGHAALEPLPPPEPPPPWRTWLLWAVLVAGAATVAFMALQLLRAPRDAPPP